MIETRRVQPGEVPRRGRSVPRTRVAAMVALLVLAAAACDTGADTSPGPPLSSTVKRGTTAPAEPDRTGSEPSDPADIFARVHGWIAYGTGEGIWAVNPAGRGRPQDHIKLSDSVGVPVAWSGDGSKLLISSPEGVFVLNADGSETRVPGVCCEYLLWNNASLSPDGSQVVYAGDPKGGMPSAIYVVDSGGGTPQLLRSSRRRWYSSDQAFFRTGLFNPTFSSDGTKIAYFDGMGDWGNSLRVMNADGTGVRVLSDVEVYADHLAWSPDGSRLVFHALTYRGEPHAGWGIWVIGADGSGLTRVIRGERDPFLSPNGSRIGYAHEDRLEIARWDGTHVRVLVPIDWTDRRDVSAAWNPLPLSAPGEEEEIAAASGGPAARDREPTASAGGSGAGPLVYVIVLLGVVGVVVLVRRARSKNASQTMRR